MSFALIMWLLIVEKPREGEHDSPTICCFLLQEKAQHLQKVLISQADKSTQTELVGHDVSSCIKQYFFLSSFIGFQTSVCLFACATVVSMH